MTRDELIEEVAEKLFQGAYGEDVKHLYFPRAYYGKLAETAINTIFDALKDPTAPALDRAVSFALNVSISNQYGWSQYMTDVWGKMLSASPLAPEE